MKKILLFSLLLGFIQLSCKKPHSDQHKNSLNGKWRMTAVKDNVSGMVISKPASISEEVDITFTPATVTTGNISGTTTRNLIGASGYSTDGIQSLAIPAISMTKVGETTWGYEFVDHITQSQSYNMEDCRTLQIKTSNKTLIFSKLR